MKLPKKLVQIYSFIALGLMGYSVILYTSEHLLIPKFLINMFVLPIVLYIVFIKYAQKNLLSIIFHVVITIGIGMLAIATDYIAWGIWSGRLYNPDGETITLTYTEIFVFLSVVGITMIFYMLFYMLYKLIKKTPNKKCRG